MTLHIFIIRGLYNMKMTLSLKDITEKRMIKALRVREVGLAKILSRAEKANRAPGSPDVYIDPFVGKPYFIDRQTFVDNFTYLNGNRINIMGWKHGNKYYVMRPTKSLAYIVQIPKYVQFNLNGMMANSRGANKPEFLVILADNSGNLDYESSSLITPALFKKMFTVPMCDVIARNSGKTGYAKKQNRSTARVNNSKSNINLSKDDANRGVQNRVNIIKAPNSTMNNTSSYRVNNSESNSSCRYMVIAQIHNNIGQRIGYLIVDRATNRRIKVSKQNMETMCKQRLVGNAKFVVRNGIGFIQGVGIQVDSLPIVHI